MPALLAAGLESWVREHGDGNDGLFTQERLPGRNPPLHACLRMMIDKRTERQRRWAFRAITADHARAVQSRLRKAVAAAGLDGDGNERQLFVLRNTQWPTGPVTEKERAEFEARGGVAATVTGEDLKTFAALGTMLTSRHPDLDRWLAARQPAHRTELLGRTLGDVAQSRPASLRQVRPPADGAAIRVGTTAVGQAPVHLELASLRRHIAIFAGSGSGKTVLLRRVVEECALHGVSAIVLDPNNDLARLGERWPEPPESWSDDDAQRAAEYLADTDVVIWTPRRQGGRPLTFQPLPAFADVLDDADEFDAAVNAAVEALAPRLNVHKATVKASQEKAVLTGALRHFARSGGSDLGEFASMLSALPEDAVTLSRSVAIAADLAERLEAVRITDPLFGGSGQSADPGMLLTPAVGKSARISVISLIGLSAEEQRQSFVNQLQMALFSWIKRHPAGDRPLGGLFVMDEAQTLAPSGKMTACTESTLRLASQARKYGLGLLFATQSPRGLHNRIPGNATTQFFGLLSHPTQIDDARGFAKAKGGDVPDIGRLKAGQFYLATEGRGFQKIRTPMCLSHHPPSPLTEEEVIARASRS